MLHAENWCVHLMPLFHSLEPKPITSTVQMSIDPTLFGALGALVATNTWSSGNQILQAAQDPDSDARKLMLCMCNLRQCRNAPLSCSELLNDFATVQSGGKPRRPRILLDFTEALFGWYCVMRRVAAPRAVHPCITTELPVARSERRYLSKLGIMHSKQESIRAQANQRIEHIFNSMKRRQIVIWLDNFYKRRFGVNPTVTDRSLNATAMCVLHIPKLGRYRGHMKLDELISLIKPTASLIRAADRRLQTWITDFISSPVQFGEIRAPLDIVRSGVKSLKWYPLTLEDKAPGGQEDLLELLSQLDEFRIHSTGQLPVLVDENIWWRIQKWMYGKNFHTLSVRAGLENFIFMYGVWHPYKFTCMHLYRKFFNCFVYLEKGILEPGAQVVTHPKLAYVEKMIASLMILAPTVIPIIDKEIDRLQRFWDSVSTREQKNATRRVLDNRTPESDRSWVDYIYATRRVPVTNVRTRLDNLKQLRLLLGDYCAAIFGVGCMVRECNWNGRTYNSGMYARTTLQWVLCILMRLSPQDPHKIKYIKTVLLALLQWTSWHSVTPGCVSSEEICEAFLSKVTHQMRKHCTKTSHEDYFDVFVLTKTSRSGDIKRRGGIQKQVITVLERRIKDFVSGNFVMPSVSWTSDRTGVVKETVSTCVQSEQLPFSEELGRSVLRTELCRTLYSLTSVVRNSDAFMDAMRSRFQEQSSQEVESYMTAHRKLCVLWKYPHGSTTTTNESRKRAREVCRQIH